METSSLQLATGLAPRDGAKKREAAGQPSTEGMPWRVVPKEVGAPACGMEARAWRESPDAPARRPQDRYLGTGSQHATAAASITRQRPRVEVAEYSVVPWCLDKPNCKRPAVPMSYSARSFRSVFQLGRPCFHFTAATATSETGISDKEKGRAPGSPSCMLLER